MQANGGEVLLVDSQADIKIVDHARKEALPGTCVAPLPSNACTSNLIALRRHSFTFIEKSLRNGCLEAPEDHVAGPRAGTVRSIGSITHPAKGSRNKFTQDDDIFLWHWVQNTGQKHGGTEGNEIYKQLEAQVTRPAATIAAKCQLTVSRTPGIHGSLGEITGSSNSRESRAQHLYLKMRLSPYCQIINLLKQTWKCDAVNRASVCHSRSPKRNCCCSMAKILRIYLSKTEQQLGRNGQVMMM